jgi:hypothetical protein
MFVIGSYAYVTGYTGDEYLKTFGEAQFLMVIVGTSGHSNCRTKRCFRV